MKSASYKHNVLADGQKNLSNRTQACGTHFKSFIQLFGICPC